MIFIKWLDQKPGIKIHVHEDLCNFGKISSWLMDGPDLERKETHLKDVSVTPAALARPGGDGGEDTAWEMLNITIFSSYVFWFVANLYICSDFVLDMIFLSGICPGAAESSGICQAGFLSLTLWLELDHMGALMAYDDQVYQ